MMEGVGVQTIEEFWGLELSTEKKVFEWGAEEDENDMDSLEFDKSLELRQACLGANAKNGERNLVQLTAENDEGESVRHTILSMRVGGTEQCSLFLTLHPPVKFELISGAGPVHIVGSSVESINPMLGDDSSSDEDEEEISSPEVRDIMNTKKRPATSPGTKPKPAKQMKLTSDTSMDSMFQTRDEEEDLEEEESDEDDFDEDDSEDDDSEEMEEEVKPPPTKKSQTNGKGKAKTGELKAKVLKTPQPIKQVSKFPSKRGVQSAPTTPKQSVEKKKDIKDEGDVKKRLLKQLPNVPKKLEKFNNFVANSFKIKDDAVKKELWEFVQKNRPEK